MQLWDHAEKSFHSYRKWYIQHQYIDSFVMDIYKYAITISVPKGAESF